jgi:hypothetical protein
MVASPSGPRGTCGRERVIRPHLEIVSAVHVAVLDFRTGNTAKNASNMAQNPQTWLQNAPELPVLADNGNGHSEEQRTINDAVKAFWSIR